MGYVLQRGLVIIMLACTGRLITVLAPFQRMQWVLTGCMTLRWLVQVSGYVKAVSSAGVFVVLARNAEARVKMGHLSDSFVKDPKEAFPEGKLVEGRVISAADGRCWITSCTRSFGSHPEGDVLCWMCQCLVVFVIAMSTLHQVQVPGGRLMQTRDIDVMPNWIGSMHRADGTACCAAGSSCL